MEQNVIFYVLSSLKHSATTYVQGTFFAGALSEFEALVADGVLRVVGGAADEVEAAKIIAGEKAQAAEKAAAAVPPKNTWGPTEKPAEVTVASTEVSTESTDTTGKVETTTEAPVVGQGDVAPAETEVDDTVL